MQQLTGNKLVQAEAISKRPIWVMEIVWLNGEYNEGVNDLYFASAAHSEIGANAPDVGKWFPFLDPLSLSAVSQSVDPVSGISTIGSMNFTLIDRNGLVSQAIREADAAGYGLTRQRCDLYLTYPGDDWADRLFMRRMQITAADTDGGSIKISSADIQRALKKQVFDPVTDVLSAAVLAADTTIALQDAVSFDVVTHPSGTFGYVQINDEIIKYSGKSANQITGCLRGQLGTLASGHSQGDDVAELIYFKENPISIARKVMAGGGVFRSNFALWGSAFEQVIWVKQACTVTSNALLAPDGTTSMDYLVPTTAAATHVVYQSIRHPTVAVAAVVAQKSAGYDRIYVKVHTGGAEFDLSTGAVLSTAYATASITAQGSSWLCVVNPDDTVVGGVGYVAGTYLIAITVVDAGGNHIFAGNGVDGVYLWGAHTDIDTYDAHIPTTNTIVTGFATSTPNLPSHWHLHMNAINHIDHNQWAVEGASLCGYDPADPTVGMQFEFVIDKSTDGKKWIEQEIMRVLGAFMPVRGTGRLGLRGYSDISQAESGIGVDAPSGAQSPVIDTDVAVKWGRLKILSSGDLTTTVRIEYDEFPKASGKFIRKTYLTDAGSVAKHGTGKTRKFSSSGLIPQGVYVAQIYQRFQRVLARFSRPPMRLECTLLPKMAAFEVGDTVRVRLPIRDTYTGADLNRVFEILKTSLIPKTGEVKVSLLAQPEQAVISGFSPPYFSDAVYQVGSPQTWDGLTNLTLPAGDYHWLGNLTIAAGVTLTISGTVRLFSTGTITVNGLINGYATGATSTATPSYVGTGGKGKNGSFTGHTNGGWFGGGSSYTGVTANGLVGSQPLHTAPPVVSVTGTAQDPITDQVTAITGFPTSLIGGKGGDGATLGYAARGIGGNGGAGLLIVARGIFITTGSVDLSGAVGAAGNYVYVGQIPGTVSDTSGQGGAGSGGTFMALAERDANGLPNLSVFTANINTNGGDSGAGSGQKLSQVIA